MTTPTLNVTLDTAEARVSRDQIVFRVDGKYWDTLKTTTGYIDPITRTGMLLPLYKDAAFWQANTTGLAQRLGKSDYTFYNPPPIPITEPPTPPPYALGSPTDPAKWVEDHHPYQGNIYLVGQGVDPNSATLNDSAFTNATWPRNRSFLLSWFAFNAGTTSAVQLECGWLSDSAYIGLRIWTDGKAEIYKNGVLVGEGNIFERHVTTQTVYGKQRQSIHRAKSTKGDSKQLAGQYVDLMLIPCRRRDLLLLSNQGGGFRFTFADLDPDNPDNEITPDACRFFWRVPVGKPKVLLAPLNYAASGSLVGRVMGSRLKPQGGETPVLTVYGDQPGYGTTVNATGSLKESDLSGAFVPDGTKHLARVQVDLTSDGQSTPFVYGAAALFDAQFASTDGSHATDLTPFVEHAELSVPDNPTDVCFKITCNRPVAMEQAGASGITVVSNRPASFKLGTVEILAGRSKPPKTRFGNSDRASKVDLEFRDYCKALEEYRISDPIPVDSLELSDGLKLFAKLAGLTDAEIDIPFFGFNLPTIGQSSQGEFALLPQVDDKALDWFVKLYETFAKHCEWMVKPTATGRLLYMRSLDDLDAAPSQLTLYTSIDDAVNVGGIDRRFAPYYVIRTYEPTPVECEANEIWVTGMNPRTGLPFEKVFIDFPSQDPTLAPSARPSNWLGEPRRIAVVDPSITDMQTANWVLGGYARRVTPSRTIQQFDAFFLLKPDGSPFWRGDKVTLYGIGDVRLTAFNGTFQNEYAGASPQDDRIWRPFTYTGEMVYATAPV